AADALLKLGLCQQRMAALQGQPPERVKLLQTARQTYEKLLSPQFKASPLQPQALFERAKCIAQTGDPNQAINELRRFTTDPLRNSPAAPMALLQLATLLRAQNKAAEAADVLAKGREFHEPALAKDPQQSGVIHLLRYHHGVALREAGKLADARTQFALVLKEAGDRPEADEAALRLGQCLKDEGVQKVELSTKALAAVKKPEDQTAALKLREEGFNLVRQAVAHLEQQADKLKEKPAAADARARMLYEAAWGYRPRAKRETETARAALVKETIKRLGPAAEKFPPPAVPLAKVPFQPQEKKAHAAYQALVAAFPDAPLATDARFELAELYADRDQHEDAIKLLSEGLDPGPPPDLPKKILLLLAPILPPTRTTNP